MTLALKQANEEGASGARPAGVAMVGSRRTVRPLRATVAGAMALGLWLAGGALLSTSPRAQQAAPAPTAPPAPPGRPWPRGDRDGRDHLRQEVLDQMRTMRVWKMTEELKLDEQQVAKLFPLLARFDERERDLAKERADLARGLRQQIDAPKPDATEIGRLIDQLFANRTKRSSLEEERFKSVRKLLSPVQQAKLVLLIPRLDEMMRQRIRDAVEGRGSGDRDWPAGGPGRPDRSDRFPDRF